MSRKAQPTHDLAAIKEKLKWRDYAIFPDASGGARALQLDECDIVDCVLSLTTGDFYKTMESKKKASLWQDVYKTSYCGIPIYLKLQIHRQRSLIISFKRDESR